MIEVTFAKIINKTDGSLILTQLIYQKNAPAIEQEIVKVPAHTTVTAHKTIPFNIVDVEANIGSLPLVVKKEEDPNIQFRFSLTWGENLFIDQMLQNLNTEQWKNLPTIQIDTASSQNSHVTLDITVEGNELEYTQIVIKEKDFKNMRA